MEHHIGYTFLSSVQFEKYSLSTLEVAVSLDDSFVVELAVDAFLLASWSFRIILKCLTAVINI